ncbi:PIN domain-containing protein [Pseudonocardia sp. KRD291]|uniref:type II toxin-antitoxin system VapC family toxin n=1 Tax=Pseudonocardia sp. KRD291 TaxID=2792007 RepID=UPI001C4A46E3|nr:PIN domain-containing protein [Pseudonocardia sp. KRD291]MBW0102567.1 PIN domain-containing protein [Pseudonocardia sp. KRD291]
MDAFDADVLIYAASADHRFGPLIRALFPATPGRTAGVGSVLLLPEVLAKPMRTGAAGELTALVGLLSRLNLRPVDAVTAEVATTVAVAYGLRAADATHLATAVVAGADRFVTNNRRGFSAAIAEIDVVYPEMLDEQFSDPFLPVRRSGWGGGGGPGRRWPTRSR